MDQGGLSTEMEYPYVADDGECKFNENGTKGASMVKQIITIPNGDELAMKAAVAKEGPISVAIEATSNFRYYKGGVLNDLECSNKFIELNHG